MAISGRFVLLALLGLVPVLLLPGWGTVLLRLPGAGRALVPGPRPGGIRARQVTLRADLPGNVTLNGTADSVLTVGNPGGAGSAAWSGTPGSPRPGRRIRVQPLDVPAGERRRA